VSLLFYPLAAMAGGLVGVIAHETSHAVTAVALGELEGAGWQGGLAGGPFVDYRAPTRWRSEAVRKAPLVVGVLAAIALVVAYRGPSLAWVAAAGVVAGLLWTSPEDLSRRRAETSAAD
jgi:hypothetical protein